MYWSYAGRMDSGQTEGRGKLAKYHQDDFFTRPTKKWRNSTKSRPVMANITFKNNILH